MYFYFLSCLSEKEKGEGEKQRKWISHRGRPGQNQEVGVLSGRPMWVADSSPWAVRAASQGCGLAGIWNPEGNLDVNPGTLIWNLDIPNGTLTTKPVVHPYAVFNMKTACPSALCIASIWLLKIQGRYLPLRNPFTALSAVSCFPLSPGDSSV